jgi:uncharacterized Zn finger protein (UPF0148 family)
MAKDYNQKEKEEECIREMAFALRSGGTLLDIACPICGSPLMKIEDKIYCKNCNREIIIYKDEKELPEEYQHYLLNQNKEPIEQTTLEETPVQKTLNRKIERLRSKLEETDDPKEIILLTNAIDKCLDTLKKTRDN